MVRWFNGIECMSNMQRALGSTPETSGVHKALLYRALEVSRLLGSLHSSETPKNKNHSI